MGNNKKNNNPFEQEIKPAFDDLDIDFELDSDRKKPQKGNEKGKKEGEIKKDKKADSDNGLFADDNFGDDFEDGSDEDGFGGSKEIKFDKSMTKEKGGHNEKAGAQIIEASNA